MAIQTGENEQAMRKILDMTRFIAITILLLHFYHYCYAIFDYWNWTSGFTNRLLNHISSTGLFSSFHKSKWIALGFLLISLMGAKGKKDEKLSDKTALSYLFLGLVFYFVSYFFLVGRPFIAIYLMLYMAVTSLGFLLVISGGTLLTRIIREKLEGDIFNSGQETFPQEERLLENEYSVNLPAQYKLKGKIRKSWINIINGFRGLLVLGTPGSGKSYFVIRHVITQHIQKGFSMFVYDFKFADLSVIVYNHWLKNKHRYAIEPEFYVINFDDLTRTHRCNPLDAKGMTDITDAAESARTILIGLNREWIKKQGDFFVESAINFVTAIIWFLKNIRMESTAHYHT